MSNHIVKALTEAIENVHRDHRDGRPAPAALDALYNRVVAAIPAVESLVAENARLRAAMEMVRRKSAPMGYDAGDSGIFDIASRALKGDD